MNVWSYTFSPPYVFIARYIVMQRDNFTFTLPRQTVTVGLNPTAEHTGCTSTNKILMGSPTAGQWLDPRCDDCALRSDVTRNCWEQWLCGFSSYFVPRYCYCRHLCALLFLLSIRCRLCIVLCCGAPPFPSIRFHSLFSPADQVPLSGAGHSTANEATLHQSSVSLWPRRRTGPSSHVPHLSPY
jgi:hypothetical protein